jgi:hypothetical protein
LIRHFPPFAQIVAALRTHADDLLDGRGLKFPFFTKSSFGGAPRLVYKEF